MYKIIDGKAISAAVKAEVKSDIEKLNLEPRLIVILVGDNPASQVYVNNKAKACEEVGIFSRTIVCSSEITQEELITTIEELNDNPRCNGILVQLPLPSHINEKAVLEAISPEKDVDAFHPVNVGKIMQGKYEFAPCTPAGIMEMLERENISVEGKHCVVVGRSNIVGKPMSMLLLHKNATVTICHSKTTNLEEICRSADILVAAVGKPNFITNNMVKEGAILIDVGINRVDGKLVGDIDFNNVKDKCSYITPVPGGVGPMTIAMLMKNTLLAAMNQQSRYESLYKFKQYLQDVVDGTAPIGKRLKDYN